MQAEPIIDLRSEREYDFDYQKALEDINYRVEHFHHTPEERDSLETIRCMIKEKVYSQKVTTKGMINGFLHRIFNRQRS